MRRVEGQALLSAIREAGASCGPDDVLLVFVMAAGDEQGLVASDGVVSRGQLRAAMAGSPSTHRFLCVDASGGSQWREESEAGGSPTLVSTREQQRAWARFFPHDDYQRFESAAAHGWTRALQKVADGWKGDLGRKGAVYIEDLAMCGDEDSAPAVPPQDGRRPLDEGLGLRTLQAVRPAAARRLRSGGEVSIDDLRSDLGKIRFEQLAGVLEALCGDGLRRADANVRRRFEQALDDSHPVRSLQRAHEVLVTWRIIDTPTEVETHLWKRLVADGKGRVALLLPATQSSSLRGAADLAVLGNGARARYKVPYGRYEGKPSGPAEARLRVELLGACFHGRWEGTMSGKWLRGDWQGVFDPRTGKVEGRILSRLQPQDGGERTPTDTVWPAVFEGTVSKDGTRLSGTWRSAVRVLPANGRWRISK